MSKDRIIWTPQPRQVEFLRRPEYEVLYGGAAGGGKELHIDTPIPTTKGWVRMGDITPGDMVIGRDGKPHPVLYVSPVKVHQAWKITFDDSASIICNDEHLWLTYTASDLAALTRRTDEYRSRRRENREARGTGKRPDLALRNAQQPTTCKPLPEGSVKRTDEIVATLRDKTGRSNHAVPVAEALQLPIAELKVDPYLLGLWLGDGSTNAGQFHTDDGLWEAFAEYGYKVVKYKGVSYGINGFQTDLKSIGVFGNKHIPDEYLWASEEQRVALLQGLMDTDGNCNKNGTCEFVNTNRLLTEGVAHLVRSLGMKCTVKESIAKLYGKDCGAKWSVKYTANRLVFRLQRKSARQVMASRRTTKFRYIVSAKRLDTCPMRCIAIDSADHLYLAGHDMVPTHNTDALLMWLLEPYKVPHYQGLLLRKTYPELEQVINRSLDLYPKIVPGSRYNDNKHVWRFPSGSRIYLGSMHRTRDMIKYQGRQYERIGFDELTHFTYEEYSYLFSRNRPNGLGVKPAIRGATNPGGIGHAWVRSRFIDNRIPEQSYLSIIKVGTKEYKRHRCFIPATVWDNPALLSNDPDYVASMAMMPEATRKALLEGSWDSFSGQAFVEWRDNPSGHKTRQWSHVIEPFKIPVNWRIFRSLDWGYSRPFSVMWYAMDNDGRIYVIRELYGSTGTPNEGVKWDPARLAQEIKRIESEVFKDRGAIRGVADPSIWDASRGESIATMMEREGIYWVPGDNKRIPGKMQMHWRLAFDSEGYPMVYVFKTCRHLIRTFPALVYDATDVEDIDTDGEDHAYDSIRYMMMDHPIPPRSHTTPAIPQFDPLDQYKPKEETMFLHM